MGHCPADRLGDLAPELDVIRGWPAVRERSAGVFYVKRTPFLHFHMDREGARWADAREGGTWRQRIAVPVGATATVRRRFLRVVRRCYRATADAVGLDRRRA